MSPKDRPNWGGKRDGAGRKPAIAGGGKTVAIVLSDTDLRYLDRVKRQNDLTSRSEAVRHVIAMARSGTKPK